MKKNNIFTPFVFKGKNKATPRFYKCINKENGLNCKGESRKGGGFVLQVGEKCFDCQFTGKLWLRVDTDASFSIDSSQSSSPQRFPSLRRSYSFCEELLTPRTPWTSKTDESEVDPFLFTSPRSLKRAGATIWRNKGAGEINIDSSDEKIGEIASSIVGQENIYSFSTTINQSDSKTSISNEKKKLETLISNSNLNLAEETSAKIAVSLTQDSTNSPASRSRNSFMWGWSESFKSQLADILKDVSYYSISLWKQEGEVLKSEIEKLLVEKQKTADENEFLKQEIINLQEYKLGIEEDKLERLVSYWKVEGEEYKSLFKVCRDYESRLRNINESDLEGIKKKLVIAKEDFKKHSLNENIPLENIQEISHMCESVAKLWAGIEKYHQEQFMAQIEIPTTSRHS